MSTSTTIRKSARPHRSPDRFDPCPLKQQCCHITAPTEKKELSPVLPELNLNNTCCICMESVDTKKNCITTECEHSFCASCLIRHLEENNTCPLCRFVLRRPVKKTPTLNPLVAESLITGLTNSAGERQDADNIAREMYFQVLNEQGHNVTDIEAAWRNASINIRTKLLQIMRGYQIVLGMNVCREISQWILYASTDQADGPPNLSEIDNGISELRENMNNINSIVGDDDSDDEMPSLNVGDDDSDDEMPSLNEIYPIFTDIDQTLLDDNSPLYPHSVDRLREPVFEYEEMGSGVTHNRQITLQPPPPPPGPPPPRPPTGPPPPATMTPYEFTRSDRDVLTHIFEFNSSYSDTFTDNISGINRIINNAVNIIDNRNRREAPQ